MRETNRSIWQRGRFRSRVAESSAIAGRMAILLRCSLNFVPLTAQGLKVTAARAATILLAKELRLECEAEEHHNDERENHGRCEKLAGAEFKAKLLGEKDCGGARGRQSSLRAVGGAKFSE